MASCVITEHLVAALCGMADFRLEDHYLLMREGRDEIRWKHAKATETALGVAWAAASTEEAFRIGRITWTGAWLEVLPFNVNGPKLRSQEWRDSLFLCYSINPTDLPYY